MSASPAASSVESRQPFRDGFGDRVRVPAGAGGHLEVLNIGAEFAVAPGTEPAVRAQVSALAGFDDPSFARVRGVDRQPNAAGTLAVIAEHVEGVRLSVLLDRARGGSLDTTPRVAIAALRQLVPAFARLRAHAAGFTHGGLAPERVVVTPGGRLVVTDAVFGSAIEQLGLSRRELWQRFRVAAPPAAGSIRLDERADLLQLALIALALLVARPIEPDEFPDGLAALARGTIAAWTPRGRPVPERVSAWLLHALQLDPRRAHGTLEDARAALTDTPAWQIDEESACRVMAAWASGETVARVARRDQVIRLVAPNAPPAETVQPALDLVQAVGDVNQAADSVVAAAAPGRAPAGDRPPRRPRRPARPPRRAPARPGPKGTWLSVLLATTLALAAGVATAHWFLLSTGGYGTLLIQSDPNGIEVCVDGETRGVTPVELRLSEGPHLVELRGRGMTRSLPLEIKAGERISRHVEFARPARARLAGGGAGQAPLTKGWLTVEAPFPVVLFENGVPLAPTEDHRIALPPGRHTIEVVGEAVGFHDSRHVQIQAGKSTTAVIEAPAGTVHLNARPWAEIWLDGRLVGETPIGNLMVPIGPHEFVFRNPELGVRRFDVTVTLLAPTRLSVDFDP